MANEENYGLDILFVVSPSNALSDYMPSYFLYLAGYLEKHGFRIDIVDPHKKNIDVNYDIIIHEIKTKNPRYIGLAAFVTDYDVITDLAKAIKKHSSAKILVGNAHPSVAPEDFLYEGSPFDIVVRGEGELTLKQFLLEYDDAKDNSHIKGIGYLEKGSIKINSNREFMDLSECGMPAYHMLDMNWYAKPSKYLIRRLPASCAVIYIGRGCPYKCVFCASNSVWNANDKTKENTVVRKRPLPVVIEELGILQNKYHFEFFYIMDDTFGVKENDIYEFCEAYSKSGMKMLWGAETRSNCIRNEEIVRTMKDAGCIQLDFGVETGSPKLLKIIKKGINVDQTIHAFSLCKVNGMRTFANILLNLPEETEEDLVLTHELLAKIKPTYISVGITQPYPGTECYSKFLNVPITKEEYCDLNRLNPPEKYRMSKHRLNLQKLVTSWHLKYGVYVPFEKSMFQADYRYWSKITKSPRRWRYLAYFLKEMFIFSFLRYIKYSLFYLMTIGFTDKFRVKLERIFLRSGSWRK